MLSYDDADTEPISPLLRKIHWHYASKIMEAEEVISNASGVYPVLITTFKCAPDSFTIDYFKNLMHAKEKPYLILELDEHGSNVGYETRIEASVRAFRNHNSGRKPDKEIDYRTINPNIESDFTDKTIVIPNWDNLACGLIASNLKREGLDVILMEETVSSIQRGMRFNSGQCIDMAWSKTGSLNSLLGEILLSIVHEVFINTEIRCFFVVYGLQRYTIKIVYG